MKALLCLSALVVSGAALVAWQHTSVAQEPEPVAVSRTKVALAEVQRAPDQLFFTGVGELEAARQVLIPAEIGGRIARIRFTSGQQVRRGDVLVSLNDAPERAERTRLQAQLTNARINHRRLQQLQQENAATQEQVDNALAARDMAAGELAHNEALLEQKTIRAPFDGRLGIRQVHEGQYLNVGDTLTSLTDTGTLYVNFSLDEQSSAHLVPGLPVQVRVDATAQHLQARITAVDPLIGRARTVQVQAMLDAPHASLKAGMHAKVEVQGPVVGSTLSVPETAITYTPYGDMVFVASHDEPEGEWTVKRVPVTVGQRRDGRAVLEKGVAEHDQVVVSGQLKLADGMVVEATDDSLQAEMPRVSMRETP